MTIEEENAKKEILLQIRQEYPIEDIKHKILDIADLKVLIIGETIIDEYA